MRGRSRSLLAGITAATLAVLGALASAPAAPAATIPVTFDLDESVNNTTCSLREAITSANNNSNAHEDACVAGQPGPSVDTITLSGTSFQILGNGDDTNVTGDFDISAASGPVVIDGATSGGIPATGIDANDVDRIFETVIGFGTVSPVTIRDIVLTDGRVTNDVGGTILLGAFADLTLDNVTVQSGNITGTSASAMRGAGLAADNGTLTILNSSFINNTITASGADAGTVRGGAIHLATSVTAASIDRSTITDNAINGDGTGAGDLQTLRGGGISTVDPGGDLTITNSTIEGSVLANGDTQEGGGIDWDDSGADSLLVHNSTFTNNTVGASQNGGAIHSNGNSRIAHVTFGPTSPATMNGAGLYDDGGVQELRNSVFETNTADDCGGGDPLSFGHNIEKGPENDCHLTGTGDVLTNVALLNPLASNGGPTQTHVPIDAVVFGHVPAASCLGADGAPLTQDQRGGPRQFDDGTVDAGINCEAGAFDSVACAEAGVTVIGTPGADTITGTVGDDAILGLGGADVIQPGAGEDRICAGDGDDAIAGGDDDVADDAYIGGNGSDTYDITDFLSGASVNLATGDIEPATSLGNETLVSIENVIGGGGGDTLIGDAGPNRLDGASGNDQVTGAGGSDQLLGGAGNLDALFARDGLFDSVDCGAGTGDSAQTDRLSLDTVSGCETVDALPEATIPPVVSPTPTPTPTPAKKCKKKKKVKKGAVAAAKKCKKKK